MPSRTDIFDFPIVQKVACPPFRRVKGDESPTARLELIHGRDQDALEHADIMLVGVGGQSIVAQGLLRSGATRLTLIDPDFFSTSNFSRQLGYPADRGQPKAHRVARNLKREAINGATIVSIADAFPHALEWVESKPTVISCLVDDNGCRESVSRYAREHHIPAVISGLGTDGMRSYTFLQMPGDDAPCLGCVFPEFARVKSACVAATIKSVYQAAATIIHFIEMALMGWPIAAQPYNLRYADLYGRIEGAHLVERRADCWLCGGAACNGK